MKNKRLLLTLSVLSVACVCGATAFLGGQDSFIFSRAVDGNTEWGHYSRLEPTWTDGGSQEFWIGCNDHSVVFERPTTGTIVDRGAPSVAEAESWKDLGDKRYLEPLMIDETHVRLGSYPQTRASGKEWLASLEKCIKVKNPTVEDHEGWSVYSTYYVQGVQLTDAFYQDFWTSGVKYRALYFKTLRTKAATGMASVNSNSEVYANNYDKDTLYFFRYDPITWRIAKTTEDEYTLIAEKVLDTTQFNTDYDATGKSTGYVNSYGDSFVRSFLNDIFYADAFNSYEAGLINTTEVDNSQSTTNSAPAAYCCSNTTDKVRLLSYSEAMSSDYGFSANSDRQFGHTAYARSQGVFCNSTRGGSLSSYAFWSTRSPSKSGTTDDGSGQYHTYFSTAGAVTQNKVVFASRGILPVINVSK